MDYNKELHIEKKIIEKDLWLLAISGLVAMVIVWLTLEAPSEEHTIPNSESIQSVQEVNE